MDVEDARTIGWRLWRVRDDRGKSLRVIAGLGGMSKATLSRIERGERSPTLAKLAALADTLQIAAPMTMLESGRCRPCKRWRAGVTR